MTLKELKAKKVVPAIRRNNNFISNDEKQAIFEKAITAEGWKILVIARSAAGVNYHLEKPVPEPHRWFCRPEDEKRILAAARRFLQGHNVVREYRDGNFIVLETATTTAEKYLSFNRPCMNTPEHRGELIFRSKDYIFRFKDEKGTVHSLYGAYIKKDMLRGNILHYENEHGVNIDYIMEF